MNIEVIPLKLRISNAYLVSGDRPILVDTGGPGDSGRILESLQQLGIEASRLALILLTHGHHDHAGSARELREISGAPIALHYADLDMVQTGTNRPLNGIHWRGRLMARFINSPFPSFAPDLIVENSFDLNPYGINGKVYHTPGHTKGSLSIILENSDALVGDLLMGGYLGGALAPAKPQLHYFVEDGKQLRNSIQLIESLQPKRLLVGHGGPLEAAQAFSWWSKGAAANLTLETSQAP